MAVKLLFSQKMRVVIGPLKRTKKRREEKRMKRREEVNRRRRLMMSMTTMLTSTGTILDPTLPILPHDLVLYNIFSRLPVKFLIRLSSVCKLWYISLVHRRYNDQQFPSAHFLQSQTDPILMFHFFNVGYNSSSYIDDHYFFYLKKEDGLMMSATNKNDERSNRSAIKLHNLLSGPNKSRSAFMGRCNGLICLYLLSNTHPRILVVNPSRRETLGIIPPMDIIQSIGYGFGFDSLTKEYKVVFMVNSAEEAETECFVYTLGSNSWRKITSATNRLPLLSSSTVKQAVSCNGTLYWGSYNHKPHEILSFDLHYETFQLIRVPDDERIIRTKLYYDMEFKGSLCFVRLEGFGSQNCMVHLHILKDKIKQVWNKETFLVPFPCDYTTRFVTFSDHVLLYWFHGEHFQFYNLHSKAYNVVEFPDGSLTDKKDRDAICRGKASCYQLYSHVENFLSLGTLASRNACTKDQFCSRDSSFVGKCSFGKIRRSRHKN